MMHTTCLNSAVSLRCRDSRLFNDPTYFLDARFETRPLLMSSSFDCCCCCCCCANNSNNTIYNRLPRINPSYSCNGLRQSTLIQFSPGKRLIFHGTRRQPCSYISGFSSLTDSDRNYCYEKLYSFKDGKKSGKGRYACWGFDDSKKEKFSSNVIDDDVEILLDLLSEDVGVGNIGVRERRRIEKKDRVQLTGKTKSVGSGAVKRDSKCNNNAVKVRSREEEDREVRYDRREERGTSMKEVNCERRKQGSSCSSYYSFSSKGEFESDNDVEIKHDGGSVRGESSYKDDHKRDTYMKNYNEEVEEKVDKVQDFGKEKGKILKNNTAEMCFGNQEWRKKSEKQLNAESGQHQSHVSVNTEQNSQQHRNNVIADQSQLRMKHKRLTETSVTDNRVIESSSSTQNRYSNTENKLTTTVACEHRGDTTSQDEYRRQSNVISEVSGIHEVDTRVASSSSSLLEARKKNLEDISTNVSHLVEDRREEHHQKIDYLTTLRESRFKSQEISDTHTTNIENTLVTRRESDTRTKKQEQQLESSSSAEKVTMARQIDLRRASVEDKRSSEVESMEGTTTLVKTGRKTTKALSFHVGMPKETSSTYKALKLNRESNLQESGSHEHSSERLETSTDELHEQSQQSSEMQRSGVLGGDAGSDVIASADQQEKSSSQLVGEFVKKAKHELSTSEVLQEKKANESKFEYDDSEQQHELKSSDSGISDKKDGASGPSDEMWHVTGSSAHQPSETDAPDDTSTRNNESGKKSGRSLWNVIGDVVRLRWAFPRSETNAPKPGGKASASSNQSTSSEAWFSGHESRSPKEASNPSSSKEKVHHEGLDTPLVSSSNTNQTSSTSPSIVEESSFPMPAFQMKRSPVIKRTSVSGKTDASGSGKMVKLEEPVPKLSPSDASGSSGSGVMVKSEEPVPGLLTGLSPSDASGSGNMVLVDQPVKDGELKRRKFARVDQVSKDRFDEWEEAYTIEAKERKNDERFMREALLEAQKAADFWEVPVGAVLVQDGKVIARGFNLVEELRDSTAHAEMICIRGASNNLRTWRLSGTTLYVTLEPCPMCAGAILQSRIDTVVWGAPNKLLGADGSWIRLFPEGEGGNGSSDKPPAPVHPFHPNMRVRRGVLSSECADVMQQFFRLRRKKDKKTEGEPPASSPVPTSSRPITHHHHHSKWFSKLHDAFSIMFCL